MIPMMLTSMAAGKVVAMRASIPRDRRRREGALWGVCIGLSVLAFTYIANAALAGDAR